MRSLHKMLSNRTTFHIFVMGKRRALYFYNHYFDRFYNNLEEKVQQKILWTFRIIEDLDQVPEVYLKHLKNTSGLYEIRIQFGGNIYRVFCFFDENSRVVIGNGFQKKTQRIPQKYMKLAEKIKKEYYDNKRKKTEKP